MMRHPLRNLGVLTAAALIAVTCTKDATGPTITRTPTDSLGPDILGTASVNGLPAFRLANGQTVVLEDLNATMRFLAQFQPGAASAADASLDIAAAPQASVMALPANVDLTANQTPVRDQGGRGTCTAFAALAAIEAAYHRGYGVTLDLSEQYAVLINKMMVLSDTLHGPSRMEDAIGSWSGGGSSYVLYVFSSGKLGLPQEKFDPYRPDAAYGDMSEGGDIPMLTGLSSQRAVDDFNLSDTLATYHIPYAISQTTFPRWAVDSGVFRATQVAYATPADRQGLTWFKTQLAAGYEIAFGVSLTKDGGMINGVWVPGDTSYAGHAMLMVGYSDSLKAFRIKNSWGSSWGSGGYAWFSYDWITAKHRVYDAAAVLAVAPPNSAAPVEQRFLGRWTLDQNGGKGVLDIYHMPGLFPSAWLQGAADQRVGTYFGPDNVARRVNGVISGNGIEFYVDWANSQGRSYDDLSGLHFSGHLLADKEHIGGSLFDTRDGQTYGFYGKKGLTFAPTPAPSPPSLAAYKGTWSLNLDGTWGTMRVTAIDSNAGRFDGTYLNTNQQSFPVVGLVSAPKPYITNLTIGNTIMSSYMFTAETGILAGGGQSVGFVAYHHNNPPAVQITYPSANANLDYDLNLLSGTALHATAQDPEDGNPCCTIEWEEQGIVVATGANATFSFSGPGLHYVDAIATDLDGATTRTSVNFTLVNAPPTARILRPAHGQQMISGLTYNDSVEAETWLTCCGKTIAYRWSSSDSTDNFPKNGAKPTNVVFGTPGTRVLTLEVSDNYGLQNQDTVTVQVIPPPPTPIIGFQTPLDQDNIQSLEYNGGTVFVNIQILPSAVQGRVISLVWQGDQQGCGEQPITLTWPIQQLPPPNTKEVWGEWNTNSLIGQCFGWGINGWLRLYVTDPNVATSHAEVYLYNPVPPSAARRP